MPSAANKTKILSISLSLMLLSGLTVDALAASLLPPPPTTQTTTTLQPPPILQPRDFSTAVTQPKESVNISIMQPVTQGDMPNFNDFTTAENFANNPANLCTNNPSLRVCAVKATTPYVGSTALSLPICPIGYEPMVRFGSSVYSPAGTLFWSTAHTIYQPTSAQVSYYQSNYYSCNVNWGDYFSGYAMSPDWDSYNGIPYWYTYYVGQSIDVGGYYSYVAYANIYSSLICHTSPHVPSSCGNGWLAGFHTHNQYYMYWGGYRYYCSRNAGYYPMVNNPPYAFATYNATASPAGTASTTAICGKAYTTHNRKP